jgi:chemotaxis protein methyltransferase CheR
MSTALERLAEFVRKETGIWVKEPQMSSLQAAVARLGPGMDAAAFLEAHSNGGSSRELLDRLIDEVTIGETFFFRQRRELDALDWHALLHSARTWGADRVHVWVAGCSTGEEAYTLGMLASEAFCSATPPVSILATDISAEALDWARTGVYGRRSLRAVDEQARERHFEPFGDRVAVPNRIKELVEFRRHNLIHDPVPPDGERRFGLIACRNVLIYFDGDTVETVVGSLERALTPGGTLVLGAADQLCDSARRLARPANTRPPLPSSAGRPETARSLRKPLVRDEAEPAGLAAALRAANEGSLVAAVEITERMLREDSLDADASFVRGMAELELGDPQAAVGSLRRALYVDPTFALAAFTLGRAHEKRGDAAAAARAYEQTLRTLDPADGRHEDILDQVDLADVATACARRIEALQGAAA